MTAPTILKGSGPVQERAGDLAQEIKALIYNRGAFLPLAAVIGVLEIVKVEIMEDQRE